jgi:hypothetical protein
MHPLKSQRCVEFYQLDENTSYITTALHRTTDEFVFPRHFLRFFFSSSFLYIFRVRKQIQFSLKEHCMHAAVYISSVNISHLHTRTRSSNFSPSLNNEKFHSCSCGTSLYYAEHCPETASREKRTPREICWRLFRENSLGTLFHLLRTLINIVLATAWYTCTYIVLKIMARVCVKTLCSILIIRTVRPRRCWLAEVLFHIFC